MLTAKSSKLALALLALAASACAPAPGVGVSPSTSPSTATTSPTPVPSATASAGTGATGAATPSAAASQNVPSGKTVVLSGTVYDESGAPVDGGTVSVNSLDANVTYHGTATTNQGSYVVNDLPEGVNVEIIATKANWTSRRRVGSFQAAATVRNEIDFGGPLADTGSAAAYFISKYPEVVKTDPAYNASNVDPGKLSYKLTLSEALDETNRHRFENALRVFPANQQAAPSGAFKDLQDLNDTTHDYNPDDTSQWAYDIKSGSIFLNETATRATVSWDSTNTVATLTFNAPLISNKDDLAKYQVGLVTDGTVIVDPFNHQLGTDKANSFTAYPASGNLIRNAFLPNTLTISGTPANGAARWAATHQSVSVFNVTQDQKDPVLQKVVYTRSLGNDSRFELTFDEPMAAFNGTPNGRMDASLSTGAILDNLTLDVGLHGGDTSKDSLKGPSNGNLTALDTTGSTAWGASSSQVDKEFKLDSANFTALQRYQLTAGADTGKLTVEVNPNDPKTVFIYVFNRPDIFDTRVVELRARVEAVADPAGNAIKGTDADKQQAISTI